MNFKIIDAPRHTATVEKFISSGASMDLFIATTTAQENKLGIKNDGTKTLRKRRIPVKVTRVTPNNKSGYTLVGTVAMEFKALEGVAFIAHISFEEGEVGGSLSVSYTKVQRGR